MATHKKSVLIGGKALNVYGSNRLTEDTEYLIFDKNSRKPFLKDEHNYLNLNNSPTALPARAGRTGLGPACRTDRVSDYTSPSGRSELLFRNSGWGKYKISVPMTIGMKPAKPVCPAGRYP